MKFSILTIALMMSFAVQAQTKDTNQAQPQAPSTQDTEIDNSAADQSTKELMKECNITDPEAVSSLESSYVMVMQNTSLKASPKQMAVALLLQSPTASQAQVSAKFGVDIGVASAVIANAQVMSAATQKSPWTQVREEKIYEIKPLEVPKPLLKSLSEDPCWKKLFEDLRKGLEQSREMDKLIIIPNTKMMWDK